MIKVVEDNKKILVAVILVPFILIGIIGLIFGDGVREVPLAIVNYDEPIQMPFMGDVSISKQFIDKVDKKVIKAIEVKNEEEAFLMIKSGKAYGIMVFPRNLTKEMMIKMEDPNYQLSEKIKLKIDKSSLIVAGVLTSTIMNTFMNIAKSSTGSNPLPLEIEGAMGIDNVVFGDYLLPGLITILVFFILVILVAFVVFKDRTKINFKDYSSFEIFTSYLIVFLVVISLSTFLMYLVSIPLFDMNFNQGMWIAAFGYFIFFILSISIGIMIGIVMKNFESIRIGVLIAVLPLFFGNVILPMEAMPSWLRPIVYVFPPYYAVKIYRGSVIKQLGLSDLTFDIFVMSVFMVVLVFATLFLIDRKIKREEI
ncbi:MAG: ABC transporter permease [Brevinematia bacterium]